jgi:hypothetical protein
MEREGDDGKQQRGEIGADEEEIEIGAADDFDLFEQVRGEWNEMIRAPETVPFVRGIRRTHDKDYNLEALPIELLVEWANRENLRTGNELEDEDSEPQPRAIGSGRESMIDGKASRSQGEFQDFRAPTKEVAKIEGVEIGGEDVELVKETVPNGDPKLVVGVVRYCGMKIVEPLLDMAGIGVSFANLSKDRRRGFGEFSVIVEKPGWDNLERHDAREFVRLKIEHGGEQRPGVELAGGVRLQGFVYTLDQFLVRTRARKVQCIRVPQEALEVAKSAGIDRLQRINRKLQPLPGELCAEASKARRQSRFRQLSTRTCRAKAQRP